MIYKTLKKHILPYLISFLSVQLVLLFQFYSRYADDLLGKDFDFYIFFSVGKYAFISTIPDSLIISIGIGIIFYVKHFYDRSIVKILKKIILPYLILVSISFTFLNWILPDSNAKLYSYIDAIKKAETVNDLEVLDPKIFRSLPLAMSLEKINNEIDTLKSQIIINEKKLDSLTALFPDTIAFLSDKTPLDKRLLFEKINCTNNATRGAGNISNLLREFNAYIYKTNHLLKKKHQAIKEKSYRLLFPVKILLLIILSIYLAFLYHDQKSLLITILGLNMSLVFIDDSILSLLNITDYRFQIITPLCIQIGVLFIVVFYHLFSKKRINP